MSFFLLLCSRSIKCYMLAYEDVNISLSCRFCHLIRFAFFFSRTRELNWSIFPVCCRLTRMTKLAQNVDWLAVCWSAWLSIFVIRGDVIIETFHRPEELFVCRNSAFFFVFAVLKSQQLRDMCKQGFGLVISDGTRVDFIATNCNHHTFTCSTNISRKSKMF